MVDAKRLKKEKMVLRGTYTIVLPDHVEPEQSEKNMIAAFNSIGYEVIDHKTWCGWMPRVNE